MREQTEMLRKQLEKDLGGGLITPVELAKRLKVHQRNVYGWMGGGQQPD